MRNVLGALGPVVADSTVSSADWLHAVGDRHPLILNPARSSGWFDGARLIAIDPAAQGEIDGCAGASLRAAGNVLQDAFDSLGPKVAVALVPYSGDAAYAVYTGGLLGGPEGWRTWGTLRPESLPALAAEAPADETMLMTDAHTDLDSGAFSAGVLEVREAVLRGEVYVLNLTRRLTSHSVSDQATCFRSLGEYAPSSMSSAWAYRDRWIASASPERFLRLQGREVHVEPVKGTRPRGADRESDEALLAELTSSEKERAEHVMIVDLERNDLGRVCVPGSIEVDPLYHVESTPYCHQAVSRVSGVLGPDSDIADLLAATFPCGSITGAPKISAMRLIERLEVTPRGPYTGALLVAVPGSLDSSVLIRTVETQGDSVRYGTGCGITLDSDPASEWDESVLKTEPVLGRVPSAALRETCRVVAGAVPLWGLHRQRLGDGGCGERLLTEVDRVALDAAASAPVSPSAPVRLTILVTPEGGVTAEITEQPSSLNVAGGPVVARVDVGDDMPVHRGRAKLADRSWWDAAHQQAVSEGAHQAILVDPDGFVADGSTAAVWLVEDDALVTVPSPPAIASVSVAYVRQVARRAGLEVRVEPFSWERFCAAEEAFLTNALGGCVAVRGRGGRLTDVVASWFAEAWGA